MKTEADTIKWLGKLIDSDKSDPEQLSYSILCQTAGSYTALRKNRFANQRFISTMIRLSEDADSFKVTKNCILSIGHTCNMYDYYPDSAFNFLWQFRGDKQYIFYVASSIWRFPKFVQQPDYKRLLLDLAKSKPEKQAIDMLYIIVPNIYVLIDDDELLINLIKIFERWINKKPDLYACKNEYPILISKLNELLNE